MDISMRAGSEPATPINVFVVEPGDQEERLRVLKEGTETVVSKQPGYLAASCHESADGRRVVNDAPWRSLRDIEAFASNPEFGAYVRRVGELAQFEPIGCDVASVHHA
jgi:heme-degrading monooxygenase HmoA